MESFKQRLGNLFDRNSELTQLCSLLSEHKKNAWLVGGCLRDLMLSRAVVDIDVTMESDPTAIAQKWANSCAGRWFWLDEDRLQSRVLMPNHMIVDFTPLRATTIGGDQCLRDFTINSFALPLNGERTYQALLDPLNGLQDLEQCSLKFCSPRSIADDPLRMLKGIRHAVTLQMNLCGEALQQIKDETSSIQSVAGERIRDELGRILLSETPVLGFEMMCQTGLLQEIFGYPHAKWDAARTFATMKKLNARIVEYSEENNDEPVIEETYSTRALFLLATFIRQYQPESLTDLLHDRLRLSRPHQRIILSLQQEPQSQWFEMALVASTGRQKALLVENLGHFPEEQMVYWSICKQILSKEKVYDLLLAYQNNQVLGRVPDLLDGHQIVDILQKSGKEVGLWQKRIKQAELAGEVDNFATALAWLKSKISD